MKIADLLREQLKSNHEVLEGTMADVTPEVASFSQTGKAQSVGASYAHAVISEDMIVSKILMGKKMMTEGADTGLSIPMPTESFDTYPDWVKNVQIDLDKLRAFAKEVYKQSDDYIASLNEESMDEEVDMGLWGKASRAMVISNFVIAHAAHLTGEISAIKGVQGLKGYPF